MSSIEEENGIHSKEVYKNGGKTSIDAYADHCKLNDTGVVAVEHTIDVTKRGKVQDITDGKVFELTEPALKEE